MEEGRNKSGAYAGEESTSLLDDRGSKSHESIAVALLSTAVAVCGSFEFGASIGYSAPTQSQIREELGLSLSEFSVFGSILTIGSMGGAVCSGYLADRLGRKWTMRISSILCFVGWLAIYLAKGVLSLDFGRLCTGFGIGILSFVVPVYIAEISPKHLRGGLTTLNQLMVCIGQSTGFIVGIVISWRNLALVGLFPTLILFGGLFFIPESPRWLAKAGRNEESEVALQRLRGRDADISGEAADIKDYAMTLAGLPSAKLQDLFDKKYIKSVIVGVGLMVFQQISGINGIGFYASQTFVAAGFPSGDIGTLAIGIIQVPITAVGALLMDWSGRRSLLMASASGMFLGALLSAISFNLKAQGLFMELDPILALVGILVYVGSFALGMGAIPWVIMSEIFPLNIKAIGGSLVAVVSWFGSWVVTYSFNFLMNWSSSGTLYLFSLACALTVLFVVRFVPETKGKTLEEIEDSLNS